MIPYWMTAVLTWMVLWWELLFAPMMLVPWRWLADRVERLPRGGGLHVLLRWNREVFLVFGALFHLGIFTSMDRLVGKDFEQGLAQLKAASER